MKRLFAILLCLALCGITSQTQAHRYGPYGYNKGAAIAGTVLGSLGFGYPAPYYYGYGYPYYW